MAQAILDKREPRANGALAYHILDIIHCFYDASAQKQHIAVESTCRQPVPLEKR